MFSDFVNPHNRQVNFQQNTFENSLIGDVESRRKRLTTGVDRLSKDQLEEIEESFNYFDKNGDGTIVAEELSEVMMSLGLDPTPTELKRMIQEFDIDGNGTIDYDEFLKMMAKKMNEREAAREAREFKRAFSVFDQDKNGFICARDLKRLMKHLGEDVLDCEIEDMIKLADLDKDGRVSFEEFVKVTEDGLKTKHEAEASKVNGDMHETALFDNSAENQTNNHQDFPPDKSLTSKSENPNSPATVSGQINNNNENRVQNDLKFTAIVDAKQSNEQNDQTSGGESNTNTLVKQTSLINKLGEVFKDTLS